MDSKKVTLARNDCDSWSYNDRLFEKSCMTTIEVTAIFIARFAATMQMMDEKDESAELEVVVNKVEK